MKQRLLNHIASIQNLSLRETCEAILTYDKFFAWPASLSFHHAYEGGLLAHTVEVCDMALGIAGLNISGKSDGAPWEQVLFPKVDRDILIAAALWHDVLKINEYDLIDWGRATPNQRHLRHTDDPFAAWIKDEARVRMFGNHEHIYGSAAQFQTTATAFGVSRTTIDAVVHCLLSHHGRKDWGSPVEPQTLEALILHQADLLSAKFGATKSQS